MASPVRLYQQEIHDHLGFFATWLPGDRVEVGDVGVIEGGRFRRETSLTELSIQCDVLAGKSTQDVQYTSTQGTTMATTAGAAVSQLAKAEISIEFSREGAFVFHAKSLRQYQLENRAAVAAKILKSYEKSKWKKEWLLVEAIHTAECATVIVSEDNSASIVLVASADVPIPGVSLADPKIGLTAKVTRGRIFHALGGKDLHPLYSCLQIKDPILGKTIVKPVRGVSAASQESPLLRPGIDSLLNS
jgi:hypothetical protein